MAQLNEDNKNDEEINMDSLNLKDKKEIRTMIESEGLIKEKVIFSEEIIKLNRKGKRQRRILVITQKAVYNLKPKKYNASQRRISIQDIGMLTLSALRFVNICSCVIIVSMTINKYTLSTHNIFSPEFAIHVPSEYDYHFISKNKEKIAKLLQKLYFNETMSKLIIVYSELKHLKDIVLTKKLAKFEDKKSKHAMQATITTMKDVLKEIDENQIDDTESNDDNENVQSPSYHIVYSDNDYSDDDQDANIQNFNFVNNYNDNE